MRLYTHYVCMYINSRTWLIRGKINNVKYWLPLSNECVDEYWFCTFINRLSFLCFASQCWCCNSEVFQMDDWFVWWYLNSFHRFLLLRTCTTKLFVAFVVIGSYNNLFSYKCWHCNYYFVWTKTLLLVLGICQWTQSRIGY